MTAIIVERFCRRQEADGNRSEPLPLVGFRDVPAFVLLGDPGAGKSTAFDSEHAASDGWLVTARDFVDLPFPTAAKGKTLFIDGLDEMRAGTTDGRAGLGAIRKRLVELGVSRFRLSCREDDWRDAADTADLKRIVADGDLQVLHLEPLSEADIAAILAARDDVPDPDAVLAEADRKGIAELLHNPQTLNLIATAFAAGQMPESRAETFDLACRQLVRETNVQHLAAAGDDAATDEQLLEAAGYLCAVQLLSGTAGIAADPTTRPSGLPRLADLSAPESLPLRAALGTKVFEKRGGASVPVHRSIAEYLGARFLAGRIYRHGLPLGRVQALMSGPDGGIVSDLRGLHAWLAVHCHSDRRRFAERDPLGVVLYGDVRSFSANDKRCLLDTLRAEVERFGNIPWAGWSSPPVGALATPDMEQVFQEAIVSPSREVADQWVLDFVLEALQHGHRMPSLVPFLLALIRDNSRWPTLRNGALVALLHQTGEDRSVPKALLEDIRKGDVEDAHEALANILLTSLFPKTISSVQALDYLNPRAEPYDPFWSYHYSKCVADAELPAIMDKLCTLEPVGSDGYGERLVHNLIIKLLPRAIVQCGDSIEASRFYDWLGLGLDNHRRPWLGGEQRKQIADWLSQHPEQVKALVRIAVLRTNAEDLELQLKRNMFRLLESHHSDVLAPWLLNEAQAQTDDAIARGLFREAFFALDWRPAIGDLTLEAFEKAAERQPRFQEALNWLCTDRDIEWRLEEAEQTQQHKSDLAKERADWINLVRENLEGIRDGTAPTGLLHDIAMAYDGHLNIARGDTPTARLLDAFDGDAELIEAAHSGLRRCIYRQDLPSVDEIVESDLNSRYHYIRSACLLGMSLLYAEDPQTIPALEENVLKRMLAFRATWLREKEPDWLDVVVRTLPQVVADVALTILPRQLKTAGRNVAWQHELMRDDAWQDIARQVLPVLLSVYPVRTKEEHLHRLESLLKGALRRLPAPALLETVRGKLRLSGMTAKQRGLWLATGLLLNPEEFTPILTKFVGRDQVRALEVANFLSDRFDPPILGERTPPATVGRLIELIGPIRGPERPLGGHAVTPEMHAADLVRALIPRLGSMAEDAAGEELTRLLSLASLARWHTELRYAWRDHLAAKREAGFRWPSLQETCRVLANGNPANAADLTALLEWHLRDLARLDRDGDTTGYKKYWNGDVPHLENHCRDRLLELLRERLRPTRISVAPEGEAADDTRVDIKATFGGVDGFGIPIEIKCNNHRRLWHAMRDQLIANYVRVPGTDGHGIYLVFWFGAKGMPLPIDGGKRPASAAELEDRLRMQLDASERRFIRVIVMDCAPPQTA